MQFRYFFVPYKLVLKHISFYKTKDVFWNLLPQNLKIERHIYVMFHNAVLGSVAFSNATRFGRLL